MDCECDLVCVKRISGGQGKGQDAGSAWHFLRPSLPQRTNFDVLAHTGWQI
mgnify:CR=1 FL=1